MEKRDKHSKKEKKESSVRTQKDLNAAIDDGYQNMQSNIQSINDPRNVNELDNIRREFINTLNMVEKLQQNQNELNYKIEKLYKENSAMRTRLAALEQLGEKTADNVTAVAEKINISNVQSAQNNMQLTVKKMDEFEMAIMANVNNSVIKSVSKLVNTAIDNAITTRVEPRLARAENSVQYLKSNELADAELVTAYRREIAAAYDTPGFTSSSENYGNKISGGNQKLLTSNSPTTAGSKNAPEGKTDSQKGFINKTFFFNEDD